jgi:PAS domain S-box-containing protein
MTADSYSFIDVAALPGIRERVATGDALLLLSADLSVVLWANGPGAALFGSDIDALTDAPSPLGAVARRQLAAVSSFPFVLALRIPAGVDSRIHRFTADAVALPDGKAATLLVVPAAVPSGERAIAGIAQPGEFAALLDGEGGILAGSPGIEGLQLSPRLLQLLIAEAASRPDRLVKRKVEAAGRVLPAGLVHLSDDANLLVVTAEGFIDLPDDVLSENDAEADESGTGDAVLSEAAPDDLSGPGVDITLSEEPSEDWYFNGSADGTAPPQAEERLAELAASAPVRFTWRTDADSRFTAVSPEFLDAVELTEREVIGQRWPDLAERFGFDRDGEIAALLGGRDTWSGGTVLWPLAYSQLFMPVDFAGLPTFSRARAFEGFRGFGVARLADTVLRPEEDQPPEAATTPSQPDSVSAPAAPLPNEPSLKEQSDQVVKLLSEVRHPANDRGLSPLERNAFAEIGKQLKGSDEAEGGSPGASLVAVPPEEAAPAANEAAISGKALPGETAERPADEDTSQTDIIAADLPGSSERPEEGDFATTDERLPNGRERDETEDENFAPEALADRTAVATFPDETAAPADGEWSDEAEAPSADEGAGVEESADPVLVEQHSASGADATDGATDDVSEPDGAQLGSVPTDAAERQESDAEADPVASSELEDVLPPEAPTLREDAAGPALEDAAPEAPTEHADGYPSEEPEAAVPDPAAEVARADVETQEDGRGEPAVSRAGDTSILDELPIPVLVHAGDRLFYANPEFFRLTGHPSLAAFESAGGLGSLFGESMEDGGGERRLTLRGAGGAEFPVETLLRTVPWNGGKALLLTLRRIEEPLPAPPTVPAPESDAETRLAEMRAIVDTATDGVVLIARDFSVRSLSRPAEALFGIDSRDAAGRPFGALFAAESQRAVAGYLDGLADNGVASVLNDGREVIGREKSGGAIPLFITIGTLPDGRGFCAVLRDITQWKRAEEELTQSRALAERASSHKTEFLARVSHEIRTPLNAIIGFSELMLDEKFGAIGSDRYRDYLRDINRSGNHVLSLVNDLLDISKIEAGQQEMAYEAVSLNDALTETVATMQPQANRERVIIRSSLSPDLPEVVADHRSVRQIALNILSNAVRFTPAGGQVIVSTAQETSGDVVFRVRDTGIGMSQAEIEQALKPFKQINSLQRSRNDGTGLGLPLTKAMVEANRARFAIASTPGEGTLVEVVFPSTRVLV